MNKQRLLGNQYPIMSYQQVKRKTIISIDPVKAYDKVQ